MRLGHGQQALIGFACLAPLGPLAEAGKILLVCVFAFGPEVVSLPAPLAEPLSVGVRLEARRASIHTGILAGWRAGSTGHG